MRVIESLEPRRLLTLQAELVTNLPTTQPPTLNLLVDSNGTIFFRGNDPAHGTEMWKSDGTPQGTVVAGETIVGPDGFISSRPYPVAIDGNVFFGTSTELWVTDGTQAGTQVLCHIGSTSPSGFAGPQDLIELDGILIFTMHDRNFGRRLWRSDGTVEGTWRYDAGGMVFSDLSTSPAQMTKVGDTVFFAAQGIGGQSLWRTDGTLEGTAKVRSFPNSLIQPPRWLTDVDGILYFAAYDNTTGFELWRSDGTPENTTIVADIRPGGSSGPANLVNVDGTLFFTANDGTNGTELWKTDGTAAGTQLVRDIAAGSANAFPDSTFPERVVEKFVLDDQLFFAANDGVSGVELWKSDGTAAGTILVKDLNPGAASSMRSSMDARGYTTEVVGGYGFFNANDGIHSTELFATDGTEAGTFIVADISPTGSNPTYLTASNTTLFFTADDDLPGDLLWKVAFPDTSAPAATASPLQFETSLNAEFKFEERIDPATVSADDLLVTHIATNQIFAATAATLSHNNSRIHFALPALPDGEYRIELSIGSVADVAGNSLASSAMLPSSTSFVLGGDANRDRSVNISDFAILASRFNMPGTFSQGDFNYNGTTEIGDFALLAGNFNEQVPKSPAAVRVATRRTEFDHGIRFREPASRELRFDVIDKIDSDAPLL